jgi:rhamnogalacturonan endolyase
MKLILSIIFLFSFYILDAQRVMEKLDRGLVALRYSENKVYLGWRFLANDPENIAFNLYRKSNNKVFKLNSYPIIKTTDFIDSTADFAYDNEYYICPVIGNKEHKPDNHYIIKANCAVQKYLSLPLQTPNEGTNIDGTKFYYTAHDASVGDLDGDGQYEIILKWIPENKGRSRYRGPIIVDAYKINGKKLWSINLGRNGSCEYFIVYDLDCDGKAEVLMMTYDGTISGTGEIIGDAEADWASKSLITKGFIVNGPEYFTVFNGNDGSVLATENYVPDRYPIDGWGGIGGNGGNDSIGNRANKFLACVAYLDGVKPSVVLCRGYFGRSVLVAWDYHNKKLTKRWIFDTGISYPPYNDASPFSGMGNHNISVADVDNDSKDEIIYGSMIVDDNGKGLCSTGLRHGDALHVADIDPERPGIEVFGIHENENPKFKSYGAALYDPKNCNIIFSIGYGTDIGRGVAEDIDPRFKGCEIWYNEFELFDCKGNIISKKKPNSCNFVIWWDADLTRELLDDNHIDKWNCEKQTTERLLTATECISNQSTKSTPCLSADILGDWREEVIWRTSDNKELHIYISTIPANNRLYTLMHDYQYRLSIVWQNVGYNQPPHTSFYMGDILNTNYRPHIIFPNQ